MEIAYLTNCSGAMRDFTAGVLPACLPGAEFDPSCYAISAIFRPSKV
jgi:hypothetical protein